MNVATASVEDELETFENGAIEPADFPHREHVRFAFEMLARYPFGETITRFACGLRQLAAKAGRPQLYHETITIAFLAVIGERRAVRNYATWPDFIAKNPDLLEKNVLLRWYPAEQLQSEKARRTFCLPAPMRR